MDPAFASPDFVTIATAPAPAAVESPPPRPALPPPVAERPTSSAIAMPPLLPPAATGPSFSSVLLPAGFLLALAAAALVLARRRRAAAPNRLLEVLETASLGPRRSLVVARVGGELLVLGASEAGIALLSTRPAPAVAALPVSAPEPVRAGAGGQGAALRGLLDRLAPRRPAREPRGSGASAFDAALAESVEDLELRRKLAGGRPGVVK